MWVKELGFLNVIEDLHHEVIRRKKKHAHEPGIPNLFMYEENQETIIDTIYKASKIERLDFLKLAELLNLKEGLRNQKN